MIESFLKWFIGPQTWGFGMMLIVMVAVTLLVFLGKKLYKRF